METYVKPYQVFACSTDPVYIGTGGYTIGRVDNTIVRDPITRIPKIPGSSICGTWRYFMALQLQNYFQENDTIHFRSDRKSRKDVEINDLFRPDTPGWAKTFDGNRYSAVKCAGSDDLPNESIVGMESFKSGHCGHCIVCKTFGFSKQNRSEQGLAAFSDLNILFFPVYTRLGTRWITSEQILLDSGFIAEKSERLTNEKIAVSEQDSREKFLNLGWLNLETQQKKTSLDLSNCNGLDVKKIIIVPDSLIAQIINSNLEVRTSVAIDPNTGAAKEGALFTSEAIPRATCFYGKVHIFNRPGSNSLQDKIRDALCDCIQYYETLGIGGMTTRGFGRMKVEMIDEKLSENACKKGGVQ